MARLPRFMLPGQPQHVIQRGNNSELIFADTNDYFFYLECLINASKKQKVDIHAYVLMTNHVHLLVTPWTNNGIGLMMQSIGRRYVQYFNQRYHRTGTLWEGRYKATLLDSEEYLLACCRYIELNPVRARIVKNPAEYPWSSYHCNALGEIDDLVTPHSIYQATGNDVGQRIKAYQALFETDIESNVMNAIRMATNKAWVLGDERFKLKIEKLLNRQVSPKARGGDHCSQKYKESKLNSN